MAEVMTPQSTRVSCPENSFDEGALREAYLIDQRELGNKLNCFRNLILRSIPRNWIHHNDSSDSRVMNFPNWAHLNVLDLDICTLQRAFRPGQQDSRVESSCYRLFSQQVITSSQFEAEISSELKVINFTNQVILRMPSSRSRKIGSLQAYIWQPGECSKKETGALEKHQYLRAGDTFNKLAIKGKPPDLQQVIFDPGTLIETFPHEQGKEIVVSNTTVQRYAFLSMPNAESFFGEVVYYDSILNYKLDDPARHVNDLSVKLFASSHCYTYCTYDHLSRDFVVSTQDVPDGELIFHVPKTWLFHVWLKKIVAQTDLEPWEYFREEQQANQYQCRMVFEPGGNLRIQMERGHFPAHTRTNAYKICLQGESSFSNFNISNLSLFRAGHLDLRSNPSQLGEDDVSMTSKEHELKEKLEPELREANDEAKEQLEPEEADDDDLQIPNGPMTRSKQSKFKTTLQHLLNIISGSLVCANPTTLVVIQAT